MLRWLVRGFAGVGGGLYLLWLWLHESNPLELVFSAVMLFGGVFALLIAWWSKLDRADSENIRRPRHGNLGGALDSAGWIKRRDQGQ